jgi:hypothetical protein
MGVPSHTKHTQALGEQCEGQQDSIQKGLVSREEDKRRALLRGEPEESAHLLPPCRHKQPNPSTCRRRAVLREGGLGRRIP